MTAPCAFCGAPTGTIDRCCDDCVTERACESAERQGLPRHVADDAALATIARAATTPVPRAEAS